MQFGLMLRAQFPGGDDDAPSNVKCDPTMSTVSSVQSRRRASRFSSNRFTRSFCVVPKARNSTSR